MIHIKYNLDNISELKNSYEQSKLKYYIPQHPDKIGIGQMVKITTRTCKWYGKYGIITKYSPAMAFVKFFDGQNTETNRSIRLRQTSMIEVGCLTHEESVKFNLIPDPKDHPYLKIKLKNI